MWIEYTLHMRQSGESHDHSFGVIDHSRLVAVVPLIKETIYGRPDLFEFGFAGLNVPYPALANGLGVKHMDKIIKEIFCEIDRLAADHGIVYSAFELNPFITLAERNSIQCNPLPFFGYNCTNIATHIIGLEQTEDNLFRSMRKGHKSDIIAGTKNGLSAKIYDRNSISEKIFDHYRRIHLIAAGRQTRGDKTWELMYKFIKEESSVLAILEHKDSGPIAAAFITVYKDAACYGSGCVKPTLASERGVMHIIIWETMKFLKSRGIRWFETGWQHTPTMTQVVPTQKEMNISLFKRGFGGMNVPLYRGEKFYSYEYMQDAIKDRLLQFKTEWMTAEHTT
jgi:hypothetical protein